MSGYMRTYGTHLDGRPVARKEALWCIRVVFRDWTTIALRRDEPRNLVLTTSGGPGSQIAGVYDVWDDGHMSHQRIVFSQEEVQSFLITQHDGTSHRVYWSMDR